MNPILATEIARLAIEAEESPRGDLQNVLDFITAASMLAQGLDEVPEMVRFLNALGSKVAEAAYSLRVLEPVIRQKISPHAGDEIGRIWGDPNIVGSGD
jgi:hypothetical protein